MSHRFPRKPKSKLYNPYTGKVKKGRYMKNISRRLHKKDYITPLVCRVGKPLNNNEEH